MVIEKTADLVANQGAQMEVLLKTKQANNAMFDFLNFNSNLHPFYRFILSMIKSRRYTPQPQPQPPQPKPNPLTQPQSTVSGTANSNANNTGESSPINNPFYGSSAVIVKQHSVIGKN